VNEVDPQTGAVAFLHCSRCIGDGNSPSLSVGVSTEGDMIVWCIIHDVLVHRFKNADLSKELLMVAGEDCDVCADCGHGHRETMH
jgi:hypothetical protein